MAAPAAHDVLGEVDALDPPGTLVTTPEVSEAFECTQRTIYNRLDSLVDDGVLKTKKIGANSRVWWRPVDDDPSILRGVSFDITERKQAEIIRDLNSTGGVRPPVALDPRTDVTPAEPIERLLAVAVDSGGDSGTSPQSSGWNWTCSQLFRSVRGL